MIIELVLGDWSNDGHSKTETFHIESNLYKEDIDSAYLKATKILGFNFINDVCSEFEDNLLPIEKYEILNNHNLIQDIDELDIELDHKLFVEIYLKIIQMGNKNFRYKILKLPTIDIGGYGLFNL